MLPGGSGLALVKGIVDYFSSNLQEAKSFKLLVGFKSPSDILFKENIKLWKNNVDITLTVDNAKEDYLGNVGLITKNIPELNIDDIKNVKVIVLGPPTMMKFTVTEFLKRGIKEEQIWVSYEREMCCGVGKCGHCKMDDTYICLEGPVFNYVKAKTLID